MKKNNMRKIVTLLFVAIFTMMTFTACKGKEIEKDGITYEYHKRIEAVEIKNETEDCLYVNFNVILLDKNKDVLYKEYYTDVELGSEEAYFVNLEDIKPEYISYNKVDSMDVEITELYEKELGTLEIFLVSLIIVLLGLLIICMAICLVWCLANLIYCIFEFIFDTFF